MDPEVANLLRKHADYLQLHGNRVTCSLNNHSLPATVQAIETFVNGKKYGQLRKRAADAAALAKYEPFIIPSKNFPGQLYCSLTCQIMQASLGTVKKHMSGKRFIAAQAEFNGDKRELMEEPELEDSSEADMDIDAASVDAEADTLTNVDANTLTHVDADSKPQDGEEQSMTSTLSDQPPSIPLAVSSNKRKHTPVNITASKSKVARTRHKPGKAKGRA